MPAFRRLRFHPVWPHTRGGRFVVGVVLAACAALLLVFWAPAHADDSDASHAESPYFFVDSAEPGTDHLPLTATRVDVRIAGAIADVTVTQHYRNEGQRPIHARCVFPGSTRAAVHGLNVRLGERVITARIRERRQARIEFDQAKKEGKASTLLEQHRPNVFQMHVANILPGDEVAVELRYTELLTPRDAVYGFVFPSVVGSLRPLALSVVEQRFAAQFPGRIARLTEGDAVLVWRDVNAPTRLLHPAADCYPALGYRIEQAGLEHDAHSRLWRRSTAVLGAQRLRVCERIEGADGASFTDASSWYWAAQLGRSRGPWHAITVTREL